MFRLDTYFEQESIGSWLQTISVYKQMYIITVPRYE